MIGFRPTRFLINASEADPPPVAIATLRVGSVANQSNNLCSCHWMQKGAEFIWRYCDENYMHAWLVG